MDFTKLLFMAIPVFSIFMNSCALIAMKRSRTLSPGIRVFSMNFLVSNLLFCTAVILSVLLRTDARFTQMKDDCIVILFGFSLQIQSYFVTSFSITAMALDRLVAIVFPFKYIKLLQGNRMKKACASMWVFGFLLTLSFNVNNSHLILSCINANYNSTYISISIFENNITVIGITNLLILIVNILLFLSLFINIAKKNHNDRLYFNFHFKKAIGNFRCLCDFTWPFLRRYHCHFCFSRRQNCINMVWKLHGYTLNVHVYCRPHSLCLEIQNV